MTKILKVLLGHLFAWRSYNNNNHIGNYTLFKKRKSILSHYTKRDKVEIDLSFTWLTTTQNIILCHFLLIIKLVRLNPMNEKAVMAFHLI